MSVLFTLSIRELFTLTYAYLVEGADEEHREAVDELLAQPLDPRSRRGRQQLLLELGVM